MKEIQNVSEAITDYLKSVKVEVNKIKDPTTNKPVQIPNFDELITAANKLDSSQTPEKSVWMIQTLLGRASSVGIKFPDSSYKVKFPDDHHIHTDMGLEWYWFGSHLNVTDQNGEKGRISVLSTFQKIRAVSQDIQKKYGWTDDEVTIVSNVGTITVDMPNHKKIYRRSPNYQWLLKEGDAQFSKKNEPFLFTCGPDSLTGSIDVLPLQWKIDDGNNMQINLTLTNKSFVDTKTSFFLQGVPKIIENGGTGKTPFPTPGIYYSWPQVLVSGTVSVGGNTYNVDSGIGWIDHQLMMSSLLNPKGKTTPVPFIDAPKPFNGWVWQYFNLKEKGQAFTGAGFIIGEMNSNPKMDYGYFLEPDTKGGWTAIFINGEINLNDPQEFPSICNNPKDSVLVKIPIKRKYSKIENEFLGDPLSGNATPWYSDGTFNNPNASLCGEFPADYIDTSGKYSDGLGYLESVGFQNEDQYRSYILGFLKEFVL